MFILYETLMELRIPVLMCNETNRYTEQCRRPKGECTCDNCCIGQVLLNIVESRLIIAFSSYLNNLSLFYSYSYIQMISWW